MVLKIPGMAGATHAVIAVLTISAGIIISGFITSEDFEFVPPYIRKPALMNVSLNYARSSFNIKTASYIPGTGNTGNCCAGHTGKVPVSDFTFIIKAEIVTASVADRHIVSSFTAYEIK